MSNAYDEITNLNADVKERSLGFDDLATFIGYMPMLCSYFSHIDKMMVDVFLKSELEKKQFQTVLDNFDFGSNVHIKGLTKPLFSFYDIRIDKKGCSEYKRPVTRKINRCNNKRNDCFQLSLF